MAGVCNILYLLVTYLYWTFKNNAFTFTIIHNLQTKLTTDRYEIGIPDKEDKGYEGSSESEGQSDCDQQVQRHVVVDICYQNIYSYTTGTARFSFIFDQYL